MTPMSARKVYRTRSGVLVTIVARRMFAHRNGTQMMKGDAFRVDTGGRHGWLWMHLLAEVAS